MFLRHIARFALEIFERTKVLSLFVCLFFLPVVQCEFQIQTVMWWWDNSCLCVSPPQADTATHLRSTKPTEARACRDLCMSRVGSMSALLTKIIMLMHTKTKFCDVVEPNGRNPSSSYAALASHWTAILFGLNCMFALLVGGPLGHVAHLHTSSIQGLWWATGSFIGLVGSVRLGQRWKGPWSLRASRASRTQVLQEVRGAKKLVLY